MPRILIVGGYGAFGIHVAERLARSRDLEIILAGRSRRKAEAAAVALQRDTRTSISGTALDATLVSPEDLHDLAPDVVVNASGPFQRQDYALAEAAIAARCHYVDLADSRSFVTGIGSLDEQARAANVLVVSGASSVPGLSSAVVQEYAPQFAQLDEIDIGISPGNSFDPGAATTASVLSYAGKPIFMRLDGADRIVYGWQDARRYRFPELGTRWISNADVPDLDLFPARYPSLRQARFGAGVEVALIHLSLWALSRLVSGGMIRDLSAYTPPLRMMKRLLGFLGSDRGGMFVTLAGRDASGAEKRIEWTLVARSGHGPFVPAIASVILSRKLARRELDKTGAMPCFGLFTLREFFDEVADLDIRWHLR